MELDVLNDRKLVMIEVVSTEAGVSFANTAHADEDQLFRVERDMVWVKHMAYVRNAGENFVSEWKMVLPTSLAERVIIRSWPDNNILEEHDLSNT